MKMVKSLLLGSAAGLVAAAGAQAAELPVKAQPVEYVKICSLYGAGFFYIPGTDTCIKIGGAVRVQAEYNTGAGGIPVGLGNATEAEQGAFTRTLTNDTNFRTRIYLSVDVRQQTDYGTLRSYFRFGVNQTTPADAGGASSTGVAYWDRAFIQFAGFTVGRTVSFFDSITSADFDYNNPRTFADSGAAGITVWAYTAQLGNGISATLSAEDPNGRAKFVDNLSGPDGAVAWSFGVNTNANGLAANVGGNGFEFPDIVGALRVDQAWGSAQVMAAMHDASGGYYGAATLNDGLVSTGHPDNAFGWAAGAGFAINLPTFGATGIANSQPNVDQFKGQAVYAQGATGYTTNGNGVDFLANGANNAGVGWLVDGIYGFGTDVELTTAWSAWVGYQHIWTPFWRTSVYGGYLNVTYDTVATSIICGPTGLGGAGLIFHLAPGSVCDPNFSIWQVGTRTQWNPVSQLDIGVDVLYSHLDTAFANATTVATGPLAVALPGKQVGPISFSDQDVWSVMFRVQRNFWP
jgi:hypothetical protein